MKLRMYLACITLCACDVAGPDPVDVAALEHEVAAANTVTPSANGWLWIDIPATTCRGGSPTGMGLRLVDDARGTLVYMQGGGGCWDATSCAENENAGLAGASFTRADFDGWALVIGDAGIFNRARADSPYRDYHQVYIPYCTGDFHAGTRSNVFVPGVPTPQQFAGAANMDIFLGMLAPLLSAGDSVVLTGSSAGSFGATLNYAKVANASAPAPVTLIADAGPFLPHMPACFQDKVRTRFGLALPPDCPSCANPAAGGLANLYPHLVAKHPNGRFGVDSALLDSTLALVLDRESRACGGGEVNVFTYYVWLLVLRDAVLAPSGVSTMFWGGLEHTFLQSEELFFSQGVGANSSVGGMRPADWTAAVEAGATLHLAP